MVTPERFSIRSRATSIAHASRGAFWMLQTQPNAWIHALATAIVCTAGFGFQISGVEWCLIVLCMTAVWAAEALNTSLELLTDLASPDFHPLAGKTKDVAAGAVLITVFGATIIAAIVFLPYFGALLLR